MRSVAVIGAGPAGLMGAEVLARAGLEVTIFERMGSVGRKFLLAGRGGLNITHSEELSRFLSRYGEQDSRLRAAIKNFSPSATRAWCDELGQPTFVGSSGRVFPKAFKSSPLLRAWLRRLADMGVQFRLRHRWIGWDASGALMLETSQGIVALKPQACILALGGASWPKLGADGGWVQLLGAQGIGVAPLRPANCGFQVPWSDHFRDRFAGQPLKRLALSFRGRTVRGEGMITRQGIEGGAVYALSAALRDAIAADGHATLEMSLRPDLLAVDLQRRLEMPRGKQSLATYLRKAAALPPVAIGLLHELCPGKLAMMDAPTLGRLIQALPLRLTGTLPIERAISTAGGVRFSELDDCFMLRRHPGTFVAGEMLDWEAPTGGYLLQACLATGVSAAGGALRWLDDQSRV
ncbi:MAG TPA: TIGR03862 family flavoprotein [Xanthobacteraceae bacterium]|jgi:uncharacterized flavoprotein (TIGR03862 family)|nr:TIGR03862 family flavoprotein [Xanthobacteraceae bacterium]